MKTNKENIKTNMTMKKSILLFFILLVPFTAKSQISVMDREYKYTPNWFIGLTGGIGLTSYSGSLAFFEDQTNCDPYTFSSKSGFTANLLFGLRAEFKIAERFDFYASLLYEDRSAEFEPLDYAGHVYVSDAKPFEPAIFNQSLDAKINVFSISPMIKYRPFDVDFGILLGPSFAFMVSDELDSKESIVSPSELYYKNGGKERTIYSGEIESKNSLLIDLKFGLNYGIMLSERIKLSPEIFYVLPLMNVTSEDDWKISSIQFLLSLSYGF